MSSLLPDVPTSDGDPALLKVLPELLVLSLVFVGRRASFLLALQEYNDLAF